LRKAPRRAVTGDQVKGQVRNATMGKNTATAKRRRRTAKAEPEKQTARNGHQGRDTQGRFAAGNPGGPGRPAGVPDKINRTIKDGILEAYERRGGVQWLLNLPDREFVRLLTKVLPKQVAADVDLRACGDLAATMRAMNDEELQRLAHATGDDDGERRDCHEEG